MEPTNTEPKQDMKGATMDETLDNLMAGQNPPEESSPQTDNVATEPSVTDTPKTDSGEVRNETGFEDVPKGFASHPAWQKQIKERDEARQEAQELRTMLDDPEVFIKYLKRQGYSDYEIKDAMRERNMEFPQKQTSQSELIEEICSEIGLNPQQLTDAEKDNLVRWTKLSEKRAERIVEKRIEPIRNRFEVQERKEHFGNQSTECREKFKSEFPGMDYEKDVLPKMTSFYDAFRQANPKREIEYSDVYNAVTRQMLIDGRSKESSQGERNKLKAQARPLGATGPATDKPAKGQSIDQTIDNFMREHPFRQT